MSFYINHKLIPMFTGITKYLKCSKLVFSVAIMSMAQHKIFEFMSPPDLTYWSVPSSKERYVLWKGNEKHIVKNSDFAKVVLNKLNKKKIENKFLTNYNYMHHIREASRAGIYISTSKSESISMTMLEQMHCGTPCIINPGHYLWGVNYETSIMSNLNINEYVENSSN